ncbi:unnamed protein product [Scytosiphon promiscuus]
MKGFGRTSLVMPLALFRRSNALTVSKRSLMLVAFRGRSRHTSGFQPPDTFDLAAQELIASASEGAGTREQRLHLRPTEGSDVFRWIQSSLRNTELAEAASRCVLLHGLFEVWGHGRNGAEAVEDASTSRRFTPPGEDTSWSLGVTSYGRSGLTKAEERLLVGGPPLVLTFRHSFMISERIESLDSDVRIRIIEDTCPPAARNLPEDVRIVEATAKRERRFYICRELQVGAAVGKGGTAIATGCGRRPIRGVLGTLALKQRRCRGPTAIEPEVALVMANLAKVRPESKVLDPFCGSCSLLLPAASMGAKTWGSDVRGPATAAVWDNADCLEMGTVRGVTNKIPLQPDRKDLGKIYRDYEALGLAPPTLGAADVRDQKSFVRKAGFFDAIVTDPPYNIKAKVVNVNQRQSTSFTQDEGGSTLTVALTDSRRQKGDDSHEEKLSAWQAGDGAKAEASANSLVGDVISSLISLARYALKPGGRLSFFLPLRGAEARLDRLPIALLDKLSEGAGDARLAVVYTTKQRMTSDNMCRWLIVLEKETGIPRGFAPMA